MKPARLQHTDPTKRFSDRVVFYVRSRPHYPPAVLAFFKRELDCGRITSLRHRSGTGI